MAQNIISCLPEGYSRLYTKKLLLQLEGNVLCDGKQSTDIVSVVSAILNVKSHFSILA